MSDIILELGIDDKGISPDLKRVEGKARKGAGDAGKAFDSEFSRRTSQTFKRLALAAAAAGAAVVGALASRAAVRAAIVQADAVNALNSALFQTGEFTKETSQGLQLFASELQKVTRFGDEAILRQLAYSKAIGATTEQSKQLVVASADLSAALGVDLGTANEQLTRTLSGTAGRLSRLVPELRGLTEEQLKAGAAIDIVAKKFQGFAARDTETFSGRVQQLSNNFGDLQETFGFFITESPAIRNAIKTFSDGIVQLNEIVQRNAAVFQSLVQNVLVGVVEGFALATKGAFFLIDAFRQLQGFARNVEIDASIKRLNGEIRDAIELNGQFASISAQARQVFIEATQANIEALEQERDIGNAAFQERTLALEEVKNKILDIGFAITENLGETGEASPFSNIVNGSKEAISSVQRLSIEFRKGSVEIAGALKNTFVNATAGAFQQFGAQLATGSLNFKSFVGLALSAVGDLAITIGTAVIAASTAIQAIPLASGIFLGAALVAVGGAIKAFSGQFGAAAGAPSIAGGGGGSGFASTPTPFQEDGPLAQEERRADQNVQLIVQGDILDSEDTGKRLLDLLNDNFKSNNGTFVGARFA
jgi:ribosomal protein L9